MEEAIKLLIVLIRIGRQASRNVLSLHRKTQLGTGLVLEEILECKIKHLKKLRQFFVITTSWNPESRHIYFD